MGAASIWAILSIPECRLKLAKTISYCPCIGVKRLSNQHFSVSAPWAPAIPTLNNKRSASKLLDISKIARTLMPRPLSSAGIRNSICGCLRFNSLIACKLLAAEISPTQTISCLRPIQDSKTLSTDFNKVTSRSCSFKKGIPNTKS